MRLPACQSLSLWERWHCEAMTERASPAGKSRRRSDRQALCQSDTIAVSELFGSGLALSVSSLCSSPAPPKGEPLACRSGSPSYNLSVSLRSTAPLVGEPLAKPFTLRGLPKPPLGRSNGDDRRQWRKQGGAVGAAASRMRAAAKQTLGAATRAVSPKVTERASPAGKSRRRSDRQALCQSDTIAAPVILGQRPCPLSRACARQLPQRGSL